MIRRHIQSNCSRPSSGFTLVELLLAITLLSILLGLAYGGFRASTRAANNGQDILEESSRMRLAHQFVHRQLNQLLPMSFSNPEEDEFAVVFEGDSNTIRYVSPMPGYLGFGGPQVQELSIVGTDNGQALVLSHALLQGFVEDAMNERAPIMLIDGIENGTFMFQGRDEDGEPGAWENSWVETGVLPLAVSLQLEFGEEAHVEWPELIASVRIDGLAIAEMLEQAQLRRPSEYSTTIQDLINRRGSNNETMYPFTKARTWRVARNPRKNSGVALIMVLWVLLLVTITTGAFALMARMDQLEAHSVMWSTQARLAAEAGLHMSILHLRDPIEETRWVPDGRSYELMYEGTLLEIKITDERGKVNINEADEESLARLFAGNGLDEDYALLLAAAVADWRDPDELERPNGAEFAAYESAGLEIGPGNHRFVLIEELLQVLGMPWELFKKMENAVTVYEESPLPDPAYGPAEALVALPDVSPEDALNFVEERHSQQPGLAGDLALPSGQAVMARGRGLTYSIQAKATLPNGVWDQLRATIRLGGTSDGRPFRILRWREGFHE